jgi:hypothetical protein
MIVHTGTSLKIVTIADRGNLASERVHLKVAKDCEASNYIILATVMSGPATVFAGTRPAYWLETKQLKVGDQIVLYTKAGTPSSSPRPDGTGINYFFFWGMRGAMFGVAGAKAMVAELSYWETGG